MVKVVDRAPYGKMLATVGGASLYTTASSCTGGCLQVWPPLLMAKGKTMPTGVADLTTVKVTIGTSHDLQVAYKGKRLYTFVSDSGSSVRGNGVGGFKVASRRLIETVGLPLRRQRGRNSPRGGTPSGGFTGGVVGRGAATARH